jgi:hypothetical protein
VRYRLALKAASSRGQIGSNFDRADLLAAVLRRICGLDQLPAFPARAEVRSALLIAALKTTGSQLVLNAAPPKKTFKFDSLSRSLYLSLAGLKSGQVVQADAALGCRAFQIRSLAELPNAVLAAAVRLHGALSLPRPIIATKPYAGRVAIAQVYDEAAAQGLSLGSLEAFKMRLAEAAREGLLDLERYDIAGPLDAALRERSRLRLGRDERHFIVNQWN